MRLIGRSKATEAGDEDEGASKGGLTASTRVDRVLARLANNGRCMETEGGPEGAEIDDEEAGNSLDSPIELLT